MRNQLLIALAVLAALIWAIFVVWGLLEPYSEETRWIALVLGIIAALTFLVLVVLGCRCLNIRRATYEPSPLGIVVGAALGLIVIVPLATYAYVGEYGVARGEYVRFLSQLLWAFGVVGGIIVFLLIIAGIIVCVRGRHDEDDGSTDPVPPAPVRKKPDPWMYSQEWAKANGDVVTWDNPSITIWDPVTNLEETRFDVVAGKNYRIIIEVRNGSAITPVQVECIGATMTVYSRIFGIGGPVEEWIIPPATPLAIPAIVPNGAQNVTFDWTAPAAGHRCLVFLIAHPNDANPANNKGQHNLVVQDANPGTALSLGFPVWNRLPESTRHRFGRKSDGPPLTAGLLLRRIIAPLIYPLSWPVRVMERRQVASLGTDKPRTLELGQEDDVELVLEQWGDRARKANVTLWSTQLSKSILRLPLVAWDDHDAAPTEVTLSINIPATATIGTIRSFSATALAQGRVIGGITALVRVKD